MNMRLANFIESNLDLILCDWVAFAKQQLPAASHMDENALLDHGKLILKEIVTDMHRPLGEDERQAKSEGQSTSASTSRHVPSRAHARQRERQGFDVEQMVAEYRALRATVVRLWGASSDAFGTDDLEDMIRFNESVDQAVAESLKVFLAEVENSRDLFLGVLGHDLRGPLNTIASCAAIEKKTRSNDSTSAIVLRSVAQMGALLDDLIMFARDRLGAGLGIDPAPMDLEPFVRDTLGELAPLSTGRDLELNVQGVTIGEWDARRLHQVVSNLVFNALKYGRPHSPVQVSLDGRGQHEVMLAVENSGKPIPPELLTSIFDPLVRAESDETDADQQMAGASLGLGLYVVREIVTAHGGTIEATSDSAITRFQIRLPRHTAAVAPGSADA